MKTVSAQQLFDANLDLVDQMDWEDSDKIEFLSLEDAGLEESDEPAYGIDSDNAGGSIYSYTDWFYDGDESAFSFM